MKKNLLLLAFALVAGRGFSQNVDSLQVVKTVDSLLTKSNDLRKAQKNVEALLPAQQAAEMSKQNWGENNARYASSLHRLATVYAGLQQFDKSEELYLKAIELRANVLGKENLDYCASLNGLGSLYYGKGDYAKTEPLFLGVKDIREKMLGKEHPDYAASLNNLAMMYHAKGEYIKAEQFFLEAKEIRGKVLGKEHPDYIWSLHGLAGTYFNKGDYAKAEALFLETKELWAKTVGKEHPNYAASLQNLGTVYYVKGDYIKAEAIYLEVKEIVERALGKEHPGYAKALGALALVYYYKNDNAKAEPLFLEKKEILAKTMGKEHPDYAVCLRNLGVLYMDYGDYTKAEQMYLEAKDILIKTVGKEHENYATTLNGLAIIYRIKGEYTKAVPLFLESIEIRAKALGKEHRDYATSLHGLAILYCAKGDYAAAEPLFLEAKEIRAKVLGKEHPAYGESLHYLATIYYEKGEYFKSESLYLETKKIWEKAFGKEHPNYANVLCNLAILYRKTNDFPKSAALFLEMNKLNHHLIEKGVIDFSEYQMLAYLRTFDNPLAQFRSFCQIYPNPELIGAGFDNALYFNGFLLENARRIARSVAEADSLTVETYQRWQGCRRRLANEYAKPINERRFVAEVEAEADAYEKTLTRNLPIFGETRHIIRWQEVQSSLKPGEAAVEFIHYDFYTPKATDSTMYAALILRPDDTAPQFIPLFEKNELKDLLRGASGGSNFLKINALYSQKSLYELIWKPLEPMLTGIKTVYCAPSGLLHRLNLAAMATPEGKVYGERRQLVVLGSTRSLAVGTKASQLVVPNNNQTITHDAYLAGGIRYDSDSTEMAYANRGASSRSLEPIALAFQPDSLSITRGGVLDYLPATAEEVQEIGQTLRLGRIETKVDTGFYATEESFRQLGVGSPSPRIIHLATHGYFFPDPAVSSKKQLAGSPAIVLTSAGGSEPVFKMSEHPMIRSGLIMAGAKQAWLTGKHPAGKEDGILTAYEISQMNLSGTELVVLSACETGLGDIVGNEGVYGLQRAFKIAGAKYLIMSLWKVDDKSTRAFMTGFYRHWLTEKQTVPEAFRATQQEMRAKYSGAYDWAGFVLIE